MHGYKKNFLIIYILFGLTVSDYCPKAFAQETSPTSTPTIIINSPTPSLTISPTPIVGSPTPTGYLAPEIIIYALSACPSDGAEFVQLKNLEAISTQINDWQLVDLAGGTELLTELNFNKQEIFQINLNKIRLNNSGDELSLYDQNHNLIDKVSYQKCQTDQLIFFHQTVLPSPTTTPQITPTVAVETNPTPQLDPTDSAAAPTSNQPKNQSSLTTKYVEHQNYKTPLTKIAKYSQKHLHSSKQQNPTVASTLLAPLPINRLPILSVIIGGTILIILGSFLIYENFNQIN